MMTKTQTHTVDKNSMTVKGAKELDSKIGKAGLVKGQGADKLKDIEDPDEDKNYSYGADAKEMKESSSTGGAFERLFKATINEEEESEENDIAIDSDEMVDEIEETDNEESDLVSDLQKVVSHLQEILDKLSEDNGGEEEGGEEEGGEEEGGDEEGGDEEPYEESVDFSSKSNMKVQGKIHPSKGTAQKGTFKPSPHPKEFKNKGEYLRTKANMKVKSSVTSGDFFK